jgi:4-aminobutyrate aminotransferase-like enzyme
MEDLDDSLSERDLVKLNLPDTPLIRTSLPGPRAKKLLGIQRRLETGSITYPDNFPTAWDTACGSSLQDVDDNRFIDWASGVSVLNVGYNNPEVTVAITGQASRIIHALEVPTQARIDLLQELHSILPRGLKDNAKVLFSITGGDAVEAGVKIARYTSSRETVLAFEGAYHGMHTGALAFTANRKYKKTRSAPGVYRAPYPYPYRDPLGDEDTRSAKRILEYVEHLFEDPDSGMESPAAILVEPIQGEGGYIVPPDDFLPGLERIARRYNVELIIDEVQTGLGRTGKMWACEWTGTRPDLMPVSKSIGGGLPLALVAYRDSLDQKLPKGFHLGTYRGNPVGCAAGAAVIRYLKKYRLAQRAARMGPGILKRFREISEKSRVLGEARGRGLMIGLELVKDKRTREPAPEITGKLQRELFKNGLVMLKAGHYANCLRFVPAVTISRELVDKGLEIFEQTLRTIEKRN